MAFLALGFSLLMFLWVFGFMLIEREKLLSGMVSIACFLFPILILTSPLEYVTENSGVVAATSLTLSATTKGQFVLIDVFFLFIALMNEWSIVTTTRAKDGI